MSFIRREFLKSVAALLAPVVVKPLQVFVPPREPYVQHRESLMGLYSHLGILPSTKELSICEGHLLEIDGWDGVGYPVLIENACTYGPEPPRVWVYDFDLWNFRHDDDFGPLHKLVDWNIFVGHHHWHAKRRFGRDFEEIARTGGGMLARQLKLREV